MSDVEPKNPVGFEREAALLDAAVASLNYALQRVDEREAREAVRVLTNKQRMALYRAKEQVSQVANAILQGEVHPVPGDNEGITT